MGVSYSHDASDIFAWLNAKVEGTARAAERTVAQVITQGEATMRHNTDRIETGAMLGAISSRMLDNSESHVSGEYGFINNFEDYFKYQTVTGFVHWRNSKYIEPTFALRDAFAESTHLAQALFEANMGGV